MDREGGGGEEAQRQIGPLPAPALRSFSFWLMTLLFDLLGSPMASFPTPIPWPSGLLGSARGKQGAKFILSLMGNS